MATLVVLGYFTTVQATEDTSQHPIIANNDNNNNRQTPLAASEGLPKELSPEQIESLETEKYTFQVQKRKKLPPQNILLNQYILI